MPLAHLKCKLGNMGLACFFFFLPKAVVRCIFRKVQLIVCIALLLVYSLPELLLQYILQYVHVVTTVLQLDNEKKSHMGKKEDV